MTLDELQRVCEWLPKLTAAACAAESLLSEPDLDLDELAHFNTYHLLRGALVALQERN